MMTLENLKVKPIKKQRQTAWKGLISHHCPCLHAIVVVIKDVIKYARLKALEDILLSILSSSRTISLYFNGCVADWTAELTVEYITNYDVSVFFFSSFLFNSRIVTEIIKAALF